MVRIVGGIILMKIGFQCFVRRPSRGGVIPATDVGKTGPGAIATILGPTSTIFCSRIELGHNSSVQTGASKHAV